MYLRRYLRSYLSIFVRRYFRKYFRSYVHVLIDTRTFEGTKVLGLDRYCSFWLSLLFFRIIVLQTRRPGTAQSSIDADSCQDFSSASCQRSFLFSIHSPRRQASFDRGEIHDLSACVFACWLKYNFPLTNAENHGFSYIRVTRVRPGRMPA